MNDLILVIPMAILTVVLVTGLGVNFSVKWIQKHTKSEVGPWVVIVRGQFLALLDTENYDFTTVKGHAAIFRDHEIAFEWSDYVDGSVVEWSEVGK